MTVAAAVVLMVTAAVVAMVLVVVMALCGWVIGQGSSQKAGHRLIGGPGHTAVELNTRLCQGCPGTASNTTADQGIHAQSGQETCKRPVAASVGICDLLFCDLPVFHVVDLKLLCVSEMLINVSVFKCYCYSHCMFSFR